MAETLEPVVSLMLAKMDDGTYTATMTVSGLPNERVGEAVLKHIERLFCGQEQEPKDA